MEKLWERVDLDWFLNNVVKIGLLKEGDLPEKKNRIKKKYTDKDWSQSAMGRLY